MTPDGAVEPPTLEAPAPPDDDGRDVTWYVVPNAAVDTDDGFGAGGRAEIAWLAPGYAPYKLSLVAQGYAAVSGYQHHRVRVDRVGLGAHRSTRVTLHLAWRQWLTDGYWGIGNGTAREAVYLPPDEGFDRDDPRRHRYQYSLLQPFAHLAVRRRIAAGSPVEVYGALNPKWSRVELYPGSLLAEERPYGTAGGWTAQLLGGVLHDTRAPEIAPKRGHLFELGGRVAPRLSGEAGTFGGALVSARAFWGGDRAVLAGRVVAEHLVGRIPFYEMVHWGGAVPIQGMGGFETLRGVWFGRWRAPGKAVANLELRTRVFTVHAGDSPLDAELAPYVDLGTVWGAADPVPMPIPVHPVAGLGVRAVFDDTFVGRVDTGFGVDAVEAPGGAVRAQSTFGFYLTFDHAF